MRVAGAALALALVACDDATVPPHQRVVGGDAAMGREAVVALGCTTCHVVPGLRGPRGHTGPSLARFGGRGYIAGVLPNTPDNLVRWLRDPPSVAPRTAMPGQDITDAQARDIAAFLVTLR